MRSFTVTLFSTFVFHHKLNDNNQNHAMVAEHHSSLVLLLTSLQINVNTRVLNLLDSKETKTLTDCFSNSVREL